jgi:hypothetical protein
MVSCRTCGRLGNFLFQFSAVYGHARKHGFDWCMPAKSMQERLWPTPKFKNIKYCGPRPGKLVQEKTPAYQKLPSEDNLLLEGYWQSERYFEHCKDEIAEILEFERQETDYVAVHVRRGDYLQFPEQFPVLPIDYYFDAISYMRGLGFRKFQIFSDDMRWCINNFVSHSFIYSEMEFNTSNSAIYDMRQIYNGAGIIAANSTFSLYPALLRSDNPIVIAPAEDRWFGPAAKHNDSPDRVPGRFIKI